MNSSFGATSPVPFLIYLFIYLFIYVLFICFLLIDVICSIFWFRRNAKEKKLCCVESNVVAE